MRGANKEGGGCREGTKFVRGGGCYPPILTGDCEGEESTNKQEEEVRERVQE